MNKLTEHRDEIQLDAMRECFVAFCELNFPDDLLVQDFISDIRYIEDKIGDRKTQENIKKVLEEFKKKK